jgi:thiamine-phosphate pyrophosphorylase
VKPRVVAITDLTITSEDEHVRAYASLASGLRSGALAIQLRGHGLPARRLVAFGRRLRAEVPSASLVVNDRLDVALALGADGVHLGERSVTVGDARRLFGDRAWISVSAHGDVVPEGADAALVSPIFASPGKGAPRGLDALRRLRAARPKLAIYALGGVTAATFGECVAAGADGVAMIRGALMEPAALAATAHEVEPRPRVD